jgi:hypothetical protein
VAHKYPRLGGGLGTEHLMSYLVRVGVSGRKEKIFWHQWILRWSLNIKYYGITLGGHSSLNQWCESTSAPA